MRQPELSNTGVSGSIRVLLWSPMGSGEHYDGPSSFAYRLYGCAAPGRFKVTLAHGNANQVQDRLFEGVHLIHPLRPTALGMARYVRTAKAWVARHAAGFDVFHGLTGYEIVMGPAYEAQRRGLPAVVFIANHRNDLGDKPGLKRLLGLPRRRRAKAAKLSALIAMSQAIHEELLSYGVCERRIARIPMGVDTNRFRPVASEAERRAVRQQLGWPDRPTVVFVGAIGRRKQPHLLIEALGMLRQRDVECQLALVGPEQEPAYCAQMRVRAKELDIERQVIWFGFTKDIGPPFRAADCFALISSGEGMPAALVEAMASGLPSIVTAVSGTTDLISDGEDGRLVGPSASDVADAIATYLRDPAVTALHGGRARAKIVRGYSTTVVLDAYERLFRRIMAGGDAAE